MPNHTPELTPELFAKIKEYADNDLPIGSTTAKEWLRAQQAEIERLSTDREFWVNLYNQECDLCKAQKGNLRGINDRISADAERMLEENERLRGELDRITERANDCLNSGDYKDHVGAEVALRDIKTASRDILSRYKRGDKTNDQATEA